MDAMILAAGFGTRLRPLTEKVAKTMIRISSEPLIVHQIRWLKRAGISNIVINLHHLGYQIEEYLGSGRAFGVNITYSHEDSILETGGGIVNALPYLQSDPFLVLNGDVWTTYPFRSSQSDAGALAHLVLVPTPSSKQGDFSLDGPYVRRPEDIERRVLTFSGISYLRQELFDDLNPTAFSLTKDLLFNRLDENQVTGEIFEGTWIDVGTPDSLKQVRLLMS